MKSLVPILVAILTLSGLAQAPSKTRVSQPLSVPGYPLKMHIKRSFLTVDDKGSFLHLTGVMNGENVEMISLLKAGGTYFNTGLLRPGDYAARVTAQETMKDGSTIQQYELALANGQHENFEVTGLYE